MAFALENHILRPVRNNRRRCANVGLLLGHRLRRWPNNKPALVQRLVFAVHKQKTLVGVFFWISPMAVHAVWPVISCTYRVTSLTYPPHSALLPRQPRNPGNSN